MVLKVNDVSDSTLKQGQKAQMMSHLKNSNYKMTYEDAKTAAAKLDNSNVIYSTTRQELPLDAAKQIAQIDRGEKLHLTKMPFSTAQQAADL